MICQTHATTSLTASAIRLSTAGDEDCRAGRLEQAYSKYLQVKVSFEVILERDGVTPAALRDLRVSLGRLGDMERVGGNLDAAYARFEQQLDIYRKILALTGETPEALRDLCVSLARLGDVERARGQLDAAYGRYEQLSRRHPQDPDADRRDAPGAAGLERQP